MQEYTKPYIQHVETNVDNTLKLRIMLSKGRLNIFWEIQKNKHTFYINNHSQNIFPMFPNFSLCFPTLEKVRAKFCFLCVVAILVNDLPLKPNRFFKGYRLY